MKYPLFIYLYLYLGGMTVKNIVEKGEIVHYEQLLLLSQCFQKSSAANASECVCRCERVNKQNLTLNSKLSGLVLYNSTWKGVFDESLFCLAVLNNHSLL